jgi:Ca2+-binding RTX toxin-like protein
MAIGAVALVPSAAMATGTLDQQQLLASRSALIHGPSGGHSTFAQTFTPQLSGSLDQVDLFLEQDQVAGNSVGITVEVRDVASGVPGPTVKATTIVPPSAIPAAASGGAFVPVMFAAPASVDANTQYAIVVYTVGAERYRWYGAVAADNGGVDPYVGGAASATAASPPTTSWEPLPTLDQAFKTYVTTASPQLPPPTPAPAVTCNGVEATIVGTPGNDVLRGTKGADVIAALGGDDEVTGNRGNDVICGGDGDDQLKGGRGDDVVVGDAGDDKLKGNRGEDDLDGSAGGDRLWGNRGDDILDGGPDAADTCRGGPGNDVTRATCERDP